MSLGDLDAYLGRIGLDRSAKLAEIHRAHVTSIPFENFDSLSGRVPALDLPHLEEKLVARRRGGYCFEHNLLLKGALEAMGLEVDTMLARVRVGPGAPDERPLNHLLLRVGDRGTTWLADVGFGGGGLLDPLPWEADAETDQSGWRYRLVEDGTELVVQVFQDGAWADCYGFVPQPVPHVDIEVANWFTATHPESPFVAGVFTGARRLDRCLSLFTSRHGPVVVVERAVGQASVTTPVELDEVPGILAERFGIPGVARDDQGRFLIEETTG